MPKTQGMELGKDLTSEYLGMVPPLTVSELPSESYPTPSFPLRALSKGPKSMRVPVWCKHRHRRQLARFDLSLAMAVSRGKGEFALGPDASWSSYRIPLAILLAGR